MTQAPRRSSTGRRLGAVVFASLIVAIASGLGGIAALPRWTGAVEALSILPVNDYYSVRHDRTLIESAPGVLGNDLNLLGGATAVKDSNPAHGTVALRADGGFTYVPAAGYVGTDSFRYHPSGLLATSATVTITVTNTSPVARNDQYSATTGVQLTIAAPGVIGNDTDADDDTLYASLVSGPGNGSLSLAANGGFTYTSGGSFTGTATFTYTVSDGLLSSPAASVTITVAAPSPSPTPTPTPAGTPRPSAPVPSGSGGAAATPTPSANPPAAGSGSTGGAGGGPFKVPGVSSGGFGGSVGGGFGSFDLTVEWAVPALALTVPGLLLILAVLAQAMAGAVWLPFVRRWLGAFGVRRRRREQRAV